MSWLSNIDRSDKGMWIGAPSAWLNQTVSSLFFIIVITSRTIAIISQLSHARQNQVPHMLRGPLVRQGSS